MTHRPAAITEWRVFFKGRNGRWWMSGQGYDTKRQAQAGARFFRTKTAVAPVRIEPAGCVDSDYLESQL